MAVGFIVLSIRFTFQKADNLPRGDHAWKIVMQVSSKLPISKNDPVIIAMPHNTEHSRVLKQSITHPGWRLARKVSSKSLSDGMIFFATQKKPSTLSIEYLVQNSSLPRWKKKPNLNAIQSIQESYLNSEDAANPQTKLVLEQIKSNGKFADLKSSIFDFVFNHIQFDASATSLDLQTILVNKKANTHGKARVFVSLCQAARIPARVTIGVLLKEDLAANIHYWASVWSEGEWRQYDLEYGVQNQLVKNYLPFSYSDDRLAYSLQKGALDLEIQIETETLNLGLFNQGEAKLIDLLDLTRLPVQTQSIVAALLLLPMGILITVMFVKVLGIKTYGTFTPAFIAMSLLFTASMTITVILLIVILFGFLGLFFLPKSIDRLPRISIVFVIAVLSMAIAVSFLDFFDLSDTNFIVLLPIVILTSLVDSIYKLVDQNGLIVALLRGFWSILVILFCFIVFSQDWLSYWLLSYPEAHLFSLACILYLSNLQNSPKWMNKKPYLYLRESHYRASKNRAQLELDL